MEETRLTFESVPVKAKRRSRRVSVWLCVLCAVLAAAFGILFTSLYYVNRFSELEPVSEAIELVKKNYYFFDDKTQESMVTGALKGLSSYMGDDYAEYYTKDEYDELLNSNSGTFIGMGVLVSDQGNSTFIITEVYDNTPAKEAGILVGDQLIRANGEPAEGKDLSEFLGFVTHGEGDVNTVVVLRDGQELTFTVTMRQVYSPYVTYKMLDDSIGYIYISGFHGQVVREVKDALDDLRGQGMEALVLDVRDDLGGSLSDVCDIADIFLPKNKVITTVRSRPFRRAGSAHRHAGQRVLRLRQRAPLRGPEGQRRGGALRHRHLRQGHRPDLLQHQLRPGRHHQVHHRRLLHARRRVHPGHGHHAGPHRGAAGRVDLLQHPLHPL